MSPKVNDTGPSSAVNVDPLIGRFLDLLWLERGLSANTLAAYRADLVQCQRWLAQRGQSLAAVTRADLLAFMAERVASGARPRSSARQLSSLRRFYRQLQREGTRTDDPSADIATPRIGRGLPKSLTEEEIERLLAAPAVTTALGLRDRAMLEVLYATGLRVSELVALRFN